MGDKETFSKRLEDLRLDVNALEEVRVHVPVLEQGVRKGTKLHTIPNAPGKQGSLQVYAAITTNDGYIVMSKKRHDEYAANQRVVSFNKP